MTTFSRTAKTHKCDSCAKKLPAQKFPTVGADKRVGECRSCRDQRLADRKAAAA